MRSPKHSSECTLFRYIKSTGFKEFCTFLRLVFSLKDSNRSSQHSGGEVHETVANIQIENGSRESQDQLSEGTSSNSDVTSELVDAEQDQSEDDSLGFLTDTNQHYLRTAQVVQSTNTTEHVQGINSMNSPSRIYASQRASNTDHEVLHEHHAPCSDSLFTFCGHILLYFCLRPTLVILPLLKRRKLKAKYSFPNVQVTSRFTLRALDVGELFSKENCSIPYLTPRSINMDNQKNSLIS